MPGRAFGRRAGRVCRARGVPGRGRVLVPGLRRGRGGPPGRAVGAKRGLSRAGRVAGGPGRARAAGVPGWGGRGPGGADPAEKLAACVGFPPVSQGDRARDSRHAYIRKFRLPGAENWWIRADFGAEVCAIHRVAIPGEKSDVCVTPQAGQAAGPWKEPPHEDSDFRHRD